MRIGGNARGSRTCHGASVASFFFMMCGCCKACRRHMREICTGLVYCSFVSVALDSPGPALARSAYSAAMHAGVELSRPSIASVFLWRVGAAKRVDDASVKFDPISSSFVSVALDSPGPALVRYAFSAAMHSRVELSRTLRREQRFHVGTAMIFWIDFRRLFWTGPVLV